MEWRDWLIVVGVLVLVGAAADAFRRVRNRNRLKLDIDDKFKDLPEYGSDDVGEVRVVKAGDAPVEPREPSFNDDDLIGAMATSSERREPELREPRRDSADDDDILLSGGLQGVGEGAGDFLGEVRTRTVATVPVAAEDVPEDRRSAKDPASEKAAVALSASPDVVDDLGDDDGILGPVRVVRAEADTADANQTSTDVRSAPDSEDSKAVAAAVLAEAQPQEDAPAVTPLVNEDQESGSETAAAEIAEAGEALEPLDQAADRLTPESTAAHTSESLVAVAPAAEELDLNRPIPELLAEQARKLAEETASEAPVEEDAPVSAEPVPVPPAVQPETVAEVESAAPAEVAEDASDKPEEPMPAPSKSNKKKGKRERRRQPRPEVQTNFFEQFPDLAPEPPASAAPTRKSGATRTDKSKPKREPAPAPDEVLVITVMARHDPFNGGNLFKLVEACGLTFGKMSIFHRHEQDNGEGPVQFSMVNAVHPGTFEPDAAAGFTTPGITFFLTMSEPSKLMEAFDCMLATAQCVADNLDGELRDEHRSSLRSQTIEHYRHKIRDFERRRLARRA